MHAKLDSFQIFWNDISQQKLWYFEFKSRKRRKLPARPNIVRGNQREISQRSLRVQLTEGRKTGLLRSSRKYGCSFSVFQTFRQLVRAGFKSGVRFLSLTPLALLSENMEVDSACSVDGVDCVWLLCAVRKPSESLRSRPSSSSGIRATDASKWSTTWRTRSRLLMWVMDWRRASTICAGRTVDCRTPSTTSSRTGFGAKTRLTDRLVGLLIEHRIMYIRVRSCDDSLCAFVFLGRLWHLLCCQTTNHWSWWRSSDQNVFCL